MFIYIICFFTSLTLVKAGDATKHEAPNINTFDGARDGRLNGPKACGWTGPFLSSGHPAALPDPNRDAMALLMSALLGGLSCKCGHSTSESPTHVPSTPKQLKLMLPTTNSPIPEAGYELHDCLCVCCISAGGEMILWIIGWHSILLWYYLYVGRSLTTRYGNLVMEYV